MEGIGCCSFDQGSRSLELRSSGHEKVYIISIRAFLCNWQGNIYYESCKVSSIFIICILSLLLLLLLFRCYLLAARWSIIDTNNTEYSGGYLSFPFCLIFLERSGENNTRYSNRVLYLYNYVPIKITILDQTLKLFKMDVAWEVLCGWTSDNIDGSWSETEERRSCSTLDSMETFPETKGNRRILL